MPLSARNQLVGTVKSIKLGAVMAEVVVQLDGGRGDRVRHHGDVGAEPGPEGRVAGEGGRQGD